MIKKFGISILLPFLFDSSFAQMITIYNATTLEPVENVYIIREDKKTAISGRDGKVNIKDIKPEDSLEFRHQSYFVFQTIWEDVMKRNFEIQLIPKVINIPVFELSVNREEDYFKNSPNKVEQIGSEEIRKYQSGNTADLLSYTGALTIQNSQMGGGSPTIRGFEANKLLLVVDGVRMNNAIYRSGHLQNIITVDQEILDRIEVLFGPGSVQYGSDALGGAILMYTKTPAISPENAKLNGNGSFNWESASSSKVAHLNLEMGGKKWAALGAFTIKEFGDLKMGTLRNHGSDTWGLIPLYSKQFSYQDSAFINHSINTQLNTGYGQKDALLKLNLAIDDSAQLVINSQYSTSTDIPRFDQLNDFEDGEPRYSIWNYGPQERLLLSANYSLYSAEKIYDKASVIAAYQHVEESRITRRFKRTSEVNRLEEVDIFSLNADFTKRSEQGRNWFYGFEVTTEKISSDAWTRTLPSGEISSASTRYPDGGSDMNTLAAYAEWRKTLWENSELQLGARYSHAFLYSRYKDTTLINLPFDEIQFNNGAVTGSAGLNIKPDKKWELGILASTGFRNPNVDDYGKVFENDGFVVVPNNQLKPEYAINGELNVLKKIGGESLTIGLNYYYTYLLEAIVRRNYQLNGNDSILYDGDLGRIQTNTNAEEAFITGFSGLIEWDINKFFSARGTVNFTKGESLTEAEALAHISPTFGIATLNFEKDAFNASLVWRYSATKNAENMAPGGTDNPSEGLNGEFPAWNIVNLLTQYELSEHAEINFGIENIFDLHYKPFASALSGAGRNLIFGFHFSF